MFIIAAFYQDPENPSKPEYLGLVALGMFLAFCLRRWHFRKRRVTHQSWIPYLFCGACCWLGLLWAHMHPALAMVPIVPFMPGPSHEELENFEEGVETAMENLALGRVRVLEDDDEVDASRTWRNSKSVRLPGGYQVPLPTMPKLPSLGKKSSKTDATDSTTDVTVSVVDNKQSTPAATPAATRGRRVSWVEEDEESSAREVTGSGAPLPRELDEIYKEASDQTGTRLRSHSAADQAKAVALTHQHDFARGRGVTIQAGLYSGLLGHHVEDSMKVIEYDDDGE